MKKVSQNNMSFSKKMQIALIVGLMLIMIPPQQGFSIGTTLGTAASLITNETDSLDPNVATDGTNVYVAYVDTDSTNADTDVFFTRSTDGGANFDTPYIIDTVNTDEADTNKYDENVVSTAANNKSVQIATSGNNVYVVWEENDPDAADTDIYIAVNTSNGASGSWTISELSDSLADSASSEPKLSVSGANVYVVWRDDISAETNIYLSRSIDSGANFIAPQKVSTTTDSDLPEVVSTGNSVYILWIDSTGDDSILFRGSHDKGATLASIEDLDLDSTNAKSAIALAVSGSTVHAIWVEATDNDLFYRGITDNGDGTFTLVPSSSLVTVRDGSSALVESTITATGTSVHVVWREAAGDLEIFHSRSIDNGATFGSPTNISDDADFSITPQILMTGTNLYIAWGTLVSGSDLDLFIRTSVDNGATFGTRASVQSHADNASFIKMAVASGLVFLVWEDDTDDSGTDSDVYFVSGTTTDTEIAFDASNYKLSETSTITITAPNSNTDDGITDETITVDVTSDATGATAISFTATENSGTPGEFIGTISFDEDASNDATDKIKAAPGSKITATFNSISNDFTIFTRTVDIIALEYNLGTSGRVTVTDKNSNLDALTKEKIDITITSANAPSTSSNPVTLELEETLIDSGIFGGASDAELRFMNSFDKLPLSRDITITLEDSTKDTTSDPDTTTVTVTTTTEGAGTAFTLTETGGSTDIFKGIISFGGEDTSSSLKKASVGDYFIIAGGEDFRGIIDGGTDNSKQAIRVNTVQGTPDTITASYKGASDTALIKADGDPGGGGGGGLVRPSVVLNAVASLALGGSSDHSPPLSTLDSISKLKSVTIPDHIKSIIENQKPNVAIAPLENEAFSLPLSINEKSYPLGSNENTIVTNKIEVGESTKFKIVFYEQSELEHVSMYMNLRDGKQDDQSDTYIIFEKRSPMKIVDRNGFFENVSVEILEKGPYEKIAIFDIKFAKPMETSDLIYKTWDLDRRGTAVKVYDALKVGEIKVEEETPIETTDTTTKEKPPVPNWVKSNARWWSEGGIDDKTFTNGISYLISEKIIDVPTKTNESKEKDENGEFIEPEEETSEVKVPDWIKTNAQWWADDLLDEETFLAGIEYMVKQEIITVR